MYESDVLLVFGARPQFIKSAPVIREIIRRHRRIRLTIIHSGQHYDPEMSDIFFSELKIPKPILNLLAGSGSHARQTATIMKRLEGPILNVRPKILVVPGDTNTTLAASLTSAKLNIPVAHIEAGLRSGDMTMPEEVNRTLTDHCSTLLFAPTMTAVRNLENEGLGKRTTLTGDTMVDALQPMISVVRRKENALLEKFKLDAQNYVLVTLHRPSNVDNLKRLGEIWRALNAVAKKLRVVFLVHPRTRKCLAELGAKGRFRESGITLNRPQGYIETLALLKNASCLLTDSGGMQKESFLLRVPCITLRSTTEWPETLAGNANQLTTRPDAIPGLILGVAFNESPRKAMKRLKNPFGDGHASVKIADLIEDAVSQKRPASP